MTIINPEDRDRRFWTAATAMTGGTGLTAVAVPFVASLAPSERARSVGAPVSVDVQGVQEGALSVVEWRRQPVFVLRRSVEMLEALQKHEELLADRQSKRSDQSAYTKNVDRSIQPAYSVMVGICTHLGYRALVFGSIRATTDTGITP